MAAGSPDVTADDQDKINTFNKAFQRLKEINAELAGKKKQKEDYEDASNELMLLDEDQVRYIVGECFYHASTEEAEERLQKRVALVAEEEGRLEQEKQGIAEQMEQLKKVLYGKFGNSINLEE